MKSYGRPKWGGIVAAILVMAALLAAIGFFFGDQLLFKFVSTVPLPEASAAVVVKDDPKLHKTLLPYIQETKLNVRYQVAMPNPKRFEMAVETTSADQGQMIKNMAALAAVAYVHLTRTHADPDTVVALTLTTGTGKIYDLRLMGLEPTPKFKDLKVMIDKYR